MLSFRPLLLALLLTPVATRGAVPSPPGDDADDLVAAARAKGLANAEGWLRLGHWRQKRLGGWESEADGPAFFLSPRGKEDPSAELEATLRAFFEPEAPGTKEEASSSGAMPADGSVSARLEGSPATATADLTADQDRAAGARPLAQRSVDQLEQAHPNLGKRRPEHPQCRFPARLAFLSGALSINPARLPLRDCPQFEAFWQRLSPRSVSFVFSSYYLNNPASAFGHTFLRIGKAAVGTVEDRFDLIDQGTDFAATVDTGNAILYAIKGFTGMFRGEFTARPFFYKVREYADFESRDLWQYELNLTEGEVALLVAHLWELGHTWFDYYYLTENCSYHVLDVLEAAAPRLHLLPHLGVITLPADSVKALFLNPGLVSSMSFRPSARTQFEARVASLAAGRLDEVAALANGEEPPGFEEEPAPERVQVLDAAVDLIDVRHGREMVNGEAPEADERRQRLLERRAELRVPSERLVVTPPARGGPEHGHGALRLGLGGGHSSADGGLAVLDFRLALHDLVDPPRGFPPRTQLEFFKLRVAYAERLGHLRLEEAWLVQTTSLNLFDRFDHRISWKMRAGAMRVVDSGCRGCVAGQLEVGGGPAFSAANGALAAAITADVELLAGGLHGLAGSPFRPGFGPGLLLRVLAGERAALLATGTWRWLPDATPSSTFQLGAEARLHLGPVSLSGAWRRTPLDTQFLFSVLAYGR